MRNLLFTLVLCGFVGLAAADCPATTVTAPQARPAAELISSAAAQAPLHAVAAQPGPVMIPASVHANQTHVMGAVRSPDEGIGDRPHGSKLVMVLAGLGAMLVIVLRRLAAAN